MADRNGIDDEILVLRDREGNYYVLTGALLEQARIPDEHNALVEEILSENSEVSGYLSSSERFHLASVGARRAGELRRLTERNPRGVTGER